MSKHDEPVGFSRKNYIKSGGGRGKGFHLFILVGIFLILWVSLMVGLNLYIKDYYHTNQWYFLWPHTICQIIWNISFGPGIESDVLKFSLVYYVLTPISATVLLSVVLHKAANSIAHDSKPTGLRHGTSRFANMAELKASKLLEVDLTPFLYVEKPESEEQVLAKLAKKRLQQKIFPVIKHGTLALILYLCFLCSLNLYLKFYNIIEQFVFLTPIQLIKILVGTPSIWLNITTLGPLLITFMFYIIINDYLKKQNKKYSIKNRPSGVCLGRVQLKSGKYMYLIEKSTNEHVLCYAPSRSGKGVGVIIPSLYTWNESSIVLDPKGENFDRTSGFLALKGIRSIRLDLEKPKHRYNPLSELKNDTIELPDEINRVVGIITSGGSKGDGKNQFWENQAKAMLTVMLTYLVAAFEPVRDKKTGQVIKATVSLYDLALFFSNINPFTNEIFEDGEDENGNPETGQQKMWKMIANYQYDYQHHLQERGLAYFDKIGSYLRSEGLRFYAQNSEVRANVVTSADQYLSLFKLPVIAAIIGASDFQLLDLVDPTQPPTALFIVNPPKDDLTGKTDQLIRLILQNLFISVLYETGLRLETSEKGLYNKLLSHKEPTKLPKEFTPLEKLMISHLYKLSIEEVELAKYEKLLINLKNGNFNNINLELYNQFVNEPKLKEIGVNKYGWNKRPVLCMMDEFPKLGKFEMMEKLLADVAGYGGKFFLIAQSDKQINEAYGEKNSIFAGCIHKIIYRPSDPKTSDEISSILGDYTHIEEDVNVNDGGGAPDVFRKKSSSKSWNQVQRRVMTSEEISKMPDEDEIIWSKQIKIYGKKIVYWQDEAFKDKDDKVYPPVHIETKSLVENEDYILEKLRAQGIDVDQYYRPDLTQNQNEPDTETSKIEQSGENKALSATMQNIAVSAAEKLKAEPEVPIMAAKPRGIKLTNNMAELRAFSEQEDEEPQQLGGDKPSLSDYLSRLQNAPDEIG